MVEVQEFTAHVLIIDDELSIGTGISGILETDGFNAAYVLTPEEGLEYIDRHSDVDIVLLDVNLRADLTGVELLPLIKERNKYLQVVMFTSHDRLDVGLECMKRGAVDFMAKPFDEVAFLRIAEAAVEKKRLEQVKDLYFDMVVHDLKNPLQCICGAFEMLQDQFNTGATPLQKKLFETAGSGIQQIQLMIGNILGVTCFEKGSLLARRESFGITEIVQSALTLFEPISLVLTTALPPLIRSDKDLYTRILVNIVGNAFRFATIGSAVTVHCDYDCCEKVLITSVTNIGSYISEEHRTLIFNKFLGVERSIGSLRGQNHGLGLTFCKMAVAALHGIITVESDAVEEKTTFVFTVKDFSIM